MAVNKLASKDKNMKTAELIREALKEFAK